MYLRHLTRVLVIATCVLRFVTPCVAFFGPAFSIDAASDVATNNAGTWAVVDASLFYEGLFVTRSTDGARTWTTPTTLGLSDAIRPRIATDGQGTWLIVAESKNTLGGLLGNDYDILTLRSTDNGSSWTAPAALNTNAASDQGNDILVELGTDRAGTWVAVWSADGATLGDTNVLFSRSADNGATWSSPAALNDLNGSTGSDNLSPDIATDHAGTWIIAWETTNPNTGGRDVVTVQSLDNGTTWSVPAVVNTNADEPGGNYRPAIATDEAGNWVMVWVLDTPKGQEFVGDLVVSYSSNNGATWSDTASLHPHFALDRGDDEQVRLATDRVGTWIVVWESNDSLSGTVRKDFDILFSRSLDNGHTWTSPAAIDVSARNDRNLIRDWRPRLAADTAGNWVVTWSSRKTSGTVNVDALASTAHRACPSAPVSGCLTPSISGKSRIRIRDAARAGRGSIKWTWRDRPANPAEFGDPTLTSAYALCVYDSVGAVPLLVFDAIAAAAATCDTAPCWSTATNGFRYKDSRLVRTAVRNVTLQSVAGGATKLQFVAKGPSLAPPRLPLTQASSVLVQLLNIETQTCWEAPYNTNRANTTLQFKALFP